MRSLEDAGKNSGNSGRFQCHDGSGRPSATADREDRLIARSAFTRPDSSLSTIRSTNSVSNCELMIIEDVSGDAQGSVPVLLSLLHATQVLDQELWSGVPFLLTAGPLWSSLEAHLQHSGT
ncbi:hypothetical protein TNCV_4109211 [Trichonephila clavipes]|nr:hypothetical protein TNCV_4109211 [Trichonephila clavipes]